MLKFALNNVRILRPFRLTFLNMAEVAELGERDALTVYEVRIIAETIQTVNA